MDDIPVFITYRDRKSMLNECLTSLYKHGWGPGSIVVIDNDSAKPLPHRPSLRLEAPYLIQADNSARQLAPWALGLVPKDRPYIVTDCDCAILAACPDDLVEKMLDILDTFPDVAKVGLGINTANFLDPPPERYRYSYKMERAVQGYPHLTGSNGTSAIAAPVDTTFAMYRAGGEWPGICGVRLEAPYLIEHLPWLNREYTEEEHLYYSRSDMTTWARTHSAASEVPPKVLVPFTALRAETIVGLQSSTIAYEMVARPIMDDEGYFDALAEAWTPTEEHMPEPFIVVEHDIVVRPETLRELRDCPEDWCAMPYPYLNEKEAWGMGCVKFSDRLICRSPHLFSRIANEGDPLHPPRHWCRLDAHIWEALTERGEVRHDHPGPALGHIGGQVVKHGCYSADDLVRVGRA
jgi:hypothetical protein